MRVVFSNCSPLRLNKLPKISCVFTQVCELLALWKSRPHSYESSVSYRVVVGVSESVTTEAMMAQSALEFCPIHFPNGRLGQDLGFGGIAFALWGKWVNQFKLRPSTGLSYRWTSRRSLCIGFSRAEAPMRRPIGTLPQFSHDLMNCSQNTRLNSVILGLSLENSHGRLYRKFRKKGTYNNDEKP